MKVFRDDITVTNILFLFSFFFLSFTHSHSHNTLSFSVCISLFFIFLHYSKQFVSQSITLFSLFFSLSFDLLRKYVRMWPPFIRSASLCVKSLVVTLTQTKQQQKDCYSVSVIVWWSVISKREGNVINFETKKKKIMKTIQKSAFLRWNIFF